MIKLYGMWRSSATWRVRNVLHFHGIPYEYQEVDLLKGENYQPDYTALNPAQRVPLMVFTKETGEKVKMAESQSICEFLDTYTRREKQLLPEDPFLRQKVREMCCVIDSAI